MDEVFGRTRFVANNVWQKRYSRENRGAIGDAHEYLIVYATSPDIFKEKGNRVPLNEDQERIYKNPDNPSETNQKKALARSSNDSSRLPAKLDV